MLTFEQIRDLIDRVAERGLQRFELEAPDFHLVIGGDAGAAKTDGEPREERLTIVESPLVGTFYRAPSPDDPPFVEVGTRVERGQPLCIVEAMKLMTEIKTEVEGTVVEIYADNKEAVQFGQPLFGIRAD